MTVAVMIILIVSSTGNRQTGANLSFALVADIPLSAKNGHFRWACSVDDRCSRSNTPMFFVQT